MSSTLVTPLLIAQPFGFGAADPAYINIPIPVPSQISVTVNAASFTDGFPPNTMTPEASGGLPFFGQDMNGILYMVSAYCANFAAGALSAYNATLSATISGYPVGCVLVNSGSGGLWLNTVDGNTTDPDTGGSGWFAFGGVGQSSIALSSTNVTVSALLAASPLIVLTGTLTANVNVILPAQEGQQWIVSNNTSGAFTVTVKTASGTGVTVPQTGAAAPTSIYSDGTNIQNTGVSTAGLAPINSPALTGTPTAPTASPATTNNTQIATTAFTQAAITAALSLYATKASPIFSGTPTAPTPAANDNSLKLATTQYVDRAVGAVPDSKSGTFTCINGVVSVPFGHTFATPPRVFVQWCYAVPDVGWIVPGSITTTGFQYQNGNSGLCNWFATTA
jgi:hypothetical protein